MVITTGTFLSAQIFIGLESKPAGRIGEAASYGLSATLKRLGFKLGRLRTGTPPRLEKSTIDFSATEEKRGDDRPTPFSFMNNLVWLNPLDQISCHMTHTSKEVKDLVLTNLHLNRHVQEEVTGPRYCPSLESKILRWGTKSHQIWLEPEGFDSPVIYPQGMSLTFPPDIQERILHSIPGLQNVKMLRPGYGVQYDFVDPRQLKV